MSTTAFFSCATSTTTCASSSAADGCAFAPFDPAVPRWEGAFGGVEFVDDARAMERSDPRGVSPVPDTRALWPHAIAAIRRSRDAASAHDSARFALAQLVIGFENVQTMLGAARLDAAIDLLADIEPERCDACRALLAPNEGAATGEAEAVTLCRACRENAEQEQAAKEPSRPRPTPRRECGRCGQWTAYGTGCIAPRKDSTYRHGPGWRDPLHEWRDIQSEQQAAKDGAP